MIVGANENAVIGDVERIWSWADGQLKVDVEPENVPEAAWISAKRAATSWTKAYEPADTTEPENVPALFVILHE
jgi:hypothetical protein